MYTDACVTVPVGTVSDDVKKFLRTSKEALEAAVSVIKPGAKVGDISATVQEHVEKHGYSCVRGLTGHGLGDTLHLFPDIPNTGRKGTGPALPKNIVIAVEPITAMGKDATKDGGDGWTICTADGSRSAHFEHTILLTSDGCEVLA
jgi:methionyl aminopeptidase